MIRKKLKKYQILLTLICALFGFWFLGLIVVLQSSIEEQQLILCFIIGILFVYAIVIRTLYGNYMACRTHQGTLLTKHSSIPFVIEVICIVISLIFIGYVFIQIANNHVQFSHISFVLIVSLNLVYIEEFDIIIIEKHRIYFHHKWMKYEDIRKIDTDRSINKYIVVLLFEKRMYSQRMHPTLY